MDFKRLKQNRLQAFVDRMPSLIIQFYDGDHLGRISFTIHENTVKRSLLGTMVVSKFDTPLQESKSIESLLIWLLSHSGGSDAVVEYKSNLEESRKIWLTPDECQLLSTL
jgi:hypothetical protein